MLQLVGLTRANKVRAQNERVSTNDVRRRYGGPALSQWSAKPPVTPSESRRAHWPMLGHEITNRRRSRSRSRSK